MGCVGPLLKVLEYISGVRDVLYMNPSVWDQRASWGPEAAW